MNIIVITDLYPICNKEKNTPKTIYDFVCGWKDLGHDVRVIKPNFILNSFIRKKPFYKTGIYGDVENVNYWMPFIFDIKKKLFNFKAPDIIIAHMPSGLIFANKLGLPFVAGVHVSDLEVLTNPVYSIYFKQELKKAYKNAKKIACRSYVLKDKFLKIFPEYTNKTFVAYSGIEDNIICQGEWEQKSKYKVLCTAQLIKRKNVDKVIEACAKFQNIDLAIIGKGKELKNLREIPSTNVTFYGHIPHKNVLDVMKNSDIFVLPSENETFGMVYLEAMASGCITIGLEGEGIDGIIKDGINGYLCKKNNLEDVLRKVINSENQNEILLQTYKTIQNYTIEKACKNYLESIF